MILLIGSGICRTTRITSCTFVVIEGGSRPLRLVAALIEAKQHFLDLLFTVPTKFDGKRAASNDSGFAISFDDFLSSLAQGRLFVQLTALLESRFAPIVLLEGDPLRVSHSQMRAESMRGALAYITAILHVPILPGPRTGRFCAPDLLGEIAQIHFIQHPAHGTMQPGETTTPRFLRR